MALWTPSLITTALWLDASDSDTIELVSGVASSWESKSDGKTFTQGTAGARPTLSAAAQNGLDVLSFDGGDVLVSTAAAGTWKFLHDGTKYTVFSIVRFGTGSDPNAAYGLLGTSAASATVGAAIWYDDRSASSRNNALNQSVFRGVGGTFVVTAVTDNVITPNTFGLLRASFDPSNATAASRAKGSWNAAAEVGANSQTGAVSTADPGWSLRIGAADGTPTFPLVGGIAEIIIITGDITTDDRQIVEGYLANKWGTTLASGHPYETAAPTTPAYYGAVRDKTGALAVGRGVRMIREADQICVAYETTDASGEYEIALLRSDTGTVTTASASVITDSGQAWTTNEWATHYGVRMTSGAQAGEWRRIASNTATALTLASALPGTTAINDTFEIAALHTLVFSGESDRNALVYSGVMPYDEQTSGA